MTIRHIVCLLSIAGSALAILCTFDWSTDKPSWFKAELPYVKPEIPFEFSRFSKLNSRFFPSWPGEFHSIKVSGGKDLYLKYHRTGWEKARMEFYRSGKIEDKQTLIRAREDWQSGLGKEIKLTNCHCNVAALDGFIECHNELSRKLKLNDAKSVARSLVSNSSEYRFFFAS